jgi:hypothetical protein
MAELKYPVSMASLALYSLAISICASRLLRTGRSGDRMRALAWILTSVQMDPCVYSASCAMATGSRSRDRVAGAWRWPHTPPSTEVKERWAVTLFLVWAFTAPSKASFTFYVEVFNETLHVWFTEPTAFKFPLLYSLISFPNDVNSIV